MLLNHVSFLIGLVGFYETCSSGEALTTEFVMECSGWETALLTVVPLAYRFSTISSDGTVNQLYFGQQSAAPAVSLGVGEPPNYNVTIRVEITDVFSSTTEYYIYAKVGYRALHLGSCFCDYCPVGYFTKEVNPRLAKRPLDFNGCLVNHGLISLVKEATGVLPLS